MQDGGFVSWEDWKPILHGLNCPCCMGVVLMPDGEELEQFITEQIEQERIKDAILKIEIENLKKAVAKGEDISGFHKGSSARADD